MDVRKFEFESKEVAQEFCKQALKGDCMVYQWYKTSTVVLRGTPPSGFNYQENFDVSEYDALMLNISGV